MKVGITVPANNPTIRHSKDGSRPIMTQAFKDWLKVTGITYQVTTSGWVLNRPATGNSYFSVTWYFKSRKDAAHFKLVWL